MTAALLAALLVVTGALVAVMAVVAWLDTPRVMEADGSRGLAALPLPVRYDESVDVEADR